MLAPPMNWLTDCLSSFAYGLVEQRDVFEEALDATVDDLLDRLLGLALVASDRLERGALGGDDVVGHVLASEVGRASERDVHGDVVREFGRSAGDLDEHGVDAATALVVLVVAECRCRQRPRCA